MENNLRTQKIIQSTRWSTKTNRENRQNQSPKNEGIEREGKRALPWRLGNNCGKNNVSEIGEKQIFIKTTVKRTEYSQIKCVKQTPR